MRLRNGKLTVSLCKTEVGCVQATHLCTVTLWKWSTEWMPVDVCPWNGWFLQEIQSQLFFCHWTTDHGARNAPSRSVQEENQNDLCWSDHWTKTKIKLLLGNSQINPQMDKIKNRCKLAVLITWLREKALGKNQEVYNGYQLTVQ